MDSIAHPRGATIGLVSREQALVLAFMLLPFISGCSLAETGPQSSTPSTPSSTAASPPPKSPSHESQPLTPTLVAPELSPSHLESTYEAEPERDPISELRSSEAPIPEVCSPLEGIPLEALVEIISNPYQPSRQGKDDGHPALDFAFYRWRGLEDIDGHPVQSILPGSVAALGFDRLPYGNMVIIRTPSRDLTVAAQEASGMGPDTALYVLYAHLQSAPNLVVGDTVTCGQVIGLAGKTGRSGAPHLHLEVRFGPKEAELVPMVYYDTRAKEEEMERYRLWTMSGNFTSVDPLLTFFPTSRP